MIHSKHLITCLYKSLTFPLTLCIGSTTTATALSDSASKLCCVLISTPDNQHPNPGCEWYQPTTISGLKEYKEYSITQIWLNYSEAQWFSSLVPVQLLLLLFLLTVHLFCYSFVDIWLRIWWSFFDWLISPRQIGVTCSFQFVFKQTFKKFILKVPSCIKFSDPQCFLVW